MRYYVQLDGRTVEVDLGADGVRIHGRPVEAALMHADGTPVRGLLFDSVTYRLAVERGPRGTWKIRLRGRAIELDVIDERAKAIREMTGTSKGALGPRPIVAPMPGMVVKVEVAAGDLVEAGQGLIIVEAMKMENELKASGPGRVARVHVRSGDAVEKDQILVDLEPLKTAS